jgi:hypothetical protein
MFDFALIEESDRCLVELRPGPSIAQLPTYPITKSSGCLDPPTCPLPVCNLFCLLTLVETYSKVSQPPKNLSQIEVCQDSRLYAFAFW